MTYFPEIFIKKYLDSNSLDAFGRLRSSSPFTILENKQIFNDEINEESWKRKLVNSATAVYDKNRASTTLYVTPDSGSRAIAQTTARANYQPGKSMETLHTFVFGTPVSGVIKRIGLFDDNNGMYLEQDGEELYLCLRSNVSGSPTVTRVSQSNWNQDPLDGTGDSTYTLDITKAQILVQDFQWLGVGRVRCGFEISGSLVGVHDFNHSNVSDSVYMSTPNLPIRVEVDNQNGSAASGSLEYICNTIISEGGLENFGHFHAIDRGSNTLNVPPGAVIPLLSIRLTSSAQGALVRPTGFSIASISNQNVLFRWALIEDPTVGGTDSPVWTPVSHSVVEFDISRDINNALTGGHVLKSGYSVGDKGGTSETREFQLESVLYHDIDNNSNELVLAVENLGATAETFVGGIDWREVT